MNTDAVERRSRFATIVDIFVAPKAAFESIRVAPAWFWAFVVASLLGIIGFVLLEPTIQAYSEHGARAMYDTSPQLASLPAAERAKRIEQGLKFTRLGVLFIPLFAPIGVLIAGLVQAAIMTLVNAFTGGTGSFSRYFSLSVHVSIIGAGLAALMLGIIVILRGGPEAFDSANAMQGAMPSLGLLVPGGSPPLRAFLSAMSIFTIWATVLLAMGMSVIGRIPRAAAWVASIVMLVLSASFGAVGAMFSRG